MDGCAEGWGGVCDDVDGPVIYDDVIGMLTAFVMARFEVEDVGASLNMYTCCGAFAVTFGKG